MKERFNAEKGISDKLILFRQEPFYMVIGIPVTPQTSFGSVYTHTFCEIIDECTEIAQ